MAILSALVVVGIHPIASASCQPQAKSCSANYGVNETFFGSGGALNSCSTTYCTKQSAGELTVGNTASTTYQAQAGFNTDRAPYLQFIVNTTNIDVGTLDTSHTKSATATFSVKTYLASGYVVVNASPPPKNGSVTLNALSSPTTSTTGTEQFGINVVANSCPANNPTSGAGGCSGSLGAVPSQVPGSGFSFGAAASGYNTSNNFKYVNGDTIASSSTSSGETDYTISYLFNVSNITAGGTYTMQHILVATSTF